MSEPERSRLVPVPINRVSHKIKSKDDLYKMFVHMGKALINVQAP